MGPEQQRLMDRLFNDPAGEVVRNFKITPGDKSCTREELCAEVNKAMDEVERRSTLSELIAEAAKHVMSPAEIEAQRQSWVCGMTARCEHGEVDFEQCGECRKETY